jgi:exopolysaccharide biosynthesis WecB/TagA/CpsF family protein
MASIDLAPPAWSGATPIPPDRAVVLGCPIDRLSLAATVAACDDLIQRRACAQQVSINVAKLVDLRRDNRLRAFVDDCTLVNADGQGVVWAARILGDPIPERVAGIDLMHELLALAEARGYRVFILGAREEVLDRAITTIQNRHPDLNLVGYHHGHFADDETDAVASVVAKARPDILFVAMSSPRKEYWLSTNARALEIPFAMGVGGSIDIVAGHTRRAPHWMQRAGLEWVFRLLQEPKRMWRRYLVTNTRFAALIVTELVRRRLAPSAPIH